MKKNILFTFFSCLFVLGFSCGNEYGYTLKGEKVFTRYFFLTNRMRHFDKSKLKSRIDDLLEQEKTHGISYKTRSDIAVNLMNLGKVDTALSILIPLAKKHTNEYNIYSNLGTCYELVGKLDSALKYISKGYKLNPDSHFGSEWIHIKILEAKIKNLKNPSWLSKNEIVKLESLIKNQDKKMSSSQVFKINRDFFYQIRTRVKFTPAPNKVIANLLITLGDFNLDQGTYENSILSYIYALEFENSHNKKRKIKEKIRFLNNKRGHQVSSVELSDIFIKMMKRSRISPDLLFLGLDDIANKLDSVHLSSYKSQDSILHLTRQIDSLKNILKEEKKYNLELLKKSKQRFYIFIFVAIGFSILLFLIFKKRK